MRLMKWRRMPLSKDVVEPFARSVVRKVGRGASFLNHRINEFSLLTIGDCSGSTTCIDCYDRI